MFRFLLKRVVQGVFVIIGISILIFILSRLVPADPARMALGPRATQAAVDQLRHEMYLDKPIYEQYFYWARGVVKGDFGKSLATKKTVASDIAMFLPATLELVIFSGLIVIVFSIILGILAVKFRNGWIDGLIRILAYTGVALPAFVVAVLLLLLFGNIWPIFPVLGRLSNGFARPPHLTGMYVLDAILAGQFKTAFNAISHLFLPALALSVGPLFQEARILRSSLHDNIEKEYIAVSTGFGLPQNIILMKYLLKPSFIPVVSVMGLDIASLMGNAFLVEKIFNWPGLSRYGINAMLSKDLNAISAVVIIIGILFLVVNIVVDLVIALIDPRIRLGGGQT